MPVLASNNDSYSVNTSAAKLIKSALRKLGVTDPDEAPTAGELDDGLEALNLMLDSWNTERLTVPSLRSDSVSISKRSVYLGPGGDLDIPRPPKLDEGQVWLESSWVDYKLAKLSFDKYQEYAGLTSTGIPCGFYYDDANPTGTLNFDITPDKAYTLIVYSWKLLAQIALNDINATILLEPGYARAIVFNLALDLADEFDVAPSANLVATATISKASIKSLNVQPIKLECDPAYLDRNYIFDIRRGF